MSGSMANEWSRYWTSGAAIVELVDDPARRSGQRDRRERAGSCARGGAFGITVNPVTPAMTHSETQVQSLFGKYLATRIAGRTIERAQCPEDLVGAVMILCSPASDVLTRQTINVNGGKAMH
jgi:Enoyl-(Acyl carrier protein) reductase